MRRMQRRVRMCELHPIPGCRSDPVIITDLVTAEIAAHRTRTGARYPACGLVEQDPFKLKAVVEVESGRLMSQMAAELGLPGRFVRNWLRCAALRGRAWSGAQLGREPGGSGCRDRTATA
jgi:hypothetical protein